MHESEVMDMLGEFLNIIAGAFKGHLAAIGYADLIQSPPVNARSKIPGGIDFDYSQDVFHEYRFSLWDQVAFIVDVTLSPVPLRKERM